MKSYLVLVSFLTACAQTQALPPPPPLVFHRAVEQYQPFGTPLGSTQKSRCPMVDPSSLPLGKIPGSLRPFVGANVTFVENDTDFFISRIRVSGKSGPVKEVVLFDGCRDQPEVGLPPHKRVYFRICPCGEDLQTGRCKAVLPGTHEATQCRVEADVEFRTGEEIGGFYKPSDDIAGRGCKWRVMNPRTGDPEDNRLVISSDRFGRACN